MITEIKKHMEIVELKTLESGDIFIRNRRAYQVSRRTEDGIVVIIDVITRAA